MCIRDSIKVFIGPSTMFGAPAVLMGADGWVDTYSNVWPQLTVAIYNAAKANDLAQSRTLQKTGAELRTFLLHPEWNMYCAIKAAMNELGLPGGYPRPPLRPLTGAHLERLRRGLGEFGVPRATGEVHAAA